MRVGVGLSHLKEGDQAVAEAYRKSLQRLGATKADFALVFYSYDFALDQAAFGGSLKRVFRDCPHYGCSTWGSFFGGTFPQADAFEAETGLMVVSFHAPDFEWEAWKVHSLREKAELWSTELSRQIDEAPKGPPSSCLVMVDSLSFSPGTGFAFLERKFPKSQFLGVGASFSVPQCSVVINGEVHLNSLLALGLYKVDPWVAVFQSIRPELNEVKINRMSENLIIEIDEKPAFYKLSEHLMVNDDLPMMSPDEFRKHMGNLYVIEKPRVITQRPRTLGESYRIISLLGSEMTTGMVAVAQGLDFSQAHYLGQKKGPYFNEEIQVFGEKLKEQCPRPQLLMLFINTIRARDKDRESSDYEMLRELFPQTPIVGIYTNGEFLGGPNHGVAVAYALP